MYKQIKANNNILLTSSPFLPGGPGGPRAPTGPCHENQKEFSITVQRSLTNGINVT